jgi:ABC-type transport system involved in cytochrome c biogenesis permease subunit
VDQHFPYRQRLQSAGSTLKVLPSSTHPGEWFSLHALKLKVYDPLKEILVPVKNFTPYSEDLFEKIRSTYEKIENELSTENLNQLGALLNQGFTDLAGKPVRSAENKTLYYPTFRQLKAEVLYYQFAWTDWCIFLYGAALLALLFAGKRHSPVLQGSSLALLFSAFALHTFILGLRWYILDRPPVSNMFETVIYVPWIAVLTGFLLRYAIPSPIPLIGASTVSLLLLIVLKITNVNSSLENVQAVLDSQFWLIIHVLMIVGSYGVFALTGVLAHFYLAGCKSQTLIRCIQQGLYMGIALLIPGTILGGIWAAQSWGRFWDWDPKESWAFITSCIYLIVIHAYTFHRIRAFGLAVGAIAGLLAVSFTWYGVNYLLGTGLHSYGFGTGGTSFYFLYVGFELVFLGVAWFLQQKSLAKKQNIFIK